MPSAAVKMVIDDPESFHLLTTDLKEMIIKGAIATVNVQAALTRKNAVDNVKDNFTLRNNFTVSQIQYTQQPQGRYSLSAIESKVGVTERADWMARQETGGVRKPSSGNRLAIPTLAARGGNRGAPVIRQKYLSKVKKVKGGSLIQKTAIAHSTNAVLFHNNNMFTVTDFSRKMDGGVTFKMEMLYTLSREETTTPAAPWLQPAAEKPAEDVENIFISQMKKLGM